MARTGMARTGFDTESPLASGSALLIAAAILGFASVVLVTFGQFPGVLLLPVSVVVAVAGYGKRRQETAPRARQASLRS